MFGGNKSVWRAPAAGARWVTQDCHWGESARGKPVPWHAPLENNEQGSCELVGASTRCEPVAGALVGKLPFSPGAQSSWCCRELLLQLLLRNVRPAAEQGTPRMLPRVSCAARGNRVLAAAACGPARCSAEAAGYHLDQVRAPAAPRGRCGAALPVSGDSTHQPCTLRTRCPEWHSVNYRLCTHDSRRARICCGHTLN